MDKWDKNRNYYWTNDANDTM